MTALPRRSLLLLTALAPWLPLRAQPSLTPPQLAAGRLLIGVERLAKLRLEQALLPERAAPEQRKTQQQLGEALRQLRATPAKQLAALPARRLTQMQSTIDEVEAFAAAPVALNQLFSDSEALVARLGFVATALSGVAVDAQAAAQVDLFTRAAGSAMRVGKINFAVAASPTATGLKVAATQALVEFASALDAVGVQQLSSAQRQDLVLAQQQWLLFRSALTDQGLVKSRERLPEVATTTDRIAEALDAMAQRAMKA